MNSLGSLGLVYLLCNGATTRVKLAANTMKAPKGDLWAALLLDKRLFVRELTAKSAEFELDCPTLNRAECLIAVKSARLEALAYASDGASDSGALFAMLKKELEKINDAGRGGNERRRALRKLCGARGKLFRGHELCCGRNSPKQEHRGVQRGFQEILRAGKRRQLLSFRQGAAAKAVRQFSRRARAYRQI